MKIKWAKNKPGFTIVELLIVIVVIGILAAIVIVAYNGVQTRARDSQRKSDLSQLAKIISLYSVDNGDYAEAGCGNGTGTGWLHSDYDGAAGPYKPINQCLIDSGHMQKPLRDPSGLNNCDNGADCHAYLKASCAAGTFVMANLETLPQDATATDGICGYSLWDTNYGVNYVVRVK